MSDVLWPGVHFGTADTPLPDPRPDPTEGPDDAELAVTPPDVVALLGFDPLEGATVEATGMTAARGEGPSPDRRRAETSLVTAWLAWMRHHLETASQAGTVNAAQIRTAYHLRQAQALELAMILNGARAEAYADAVDRLPSEAFSRPAVDPAEAAQRLTDGSTDHALGIVRTWNSEVDRAADQAESRGLEGAALVTVLGEWAEERLPWKGRQIAVTEITDAEGQAQADWAANHPGQTVGQMRWVARLDDRTCPRCRALHGQLVDPATTAPPAHVHCRCHLTPPGTAPAEDVWRNWREWGSREPGDGDDPADDEDADE